MKRLLHLTVALCFVLGSVASASAVEITASGSFDFMWGWVTNQDGFSANQDMKNAPVRGGQGDPGLAQGAGNGTDDNFRAWQRERLQVNFIASENVQGVLYFEMGETAWGGNQAQSGQIGTDGVGVEIRRAYVDFNVPNTELLFRVGLQGIALPGAVAGSPILDDDMAAAVATYTINDSVTIGAFWARPWDTTNMRGGGEGASINDEFDVVGLYAPITIDGVMSLNPFVAYGIAGTDYLYTGTASNNIGLTTNAVDTGWANARNGYLDNDYQYLWFAGASLEFTMLDPLTFAMDVMWGASIDPSQDYLERWGWYLAARADYQTPYVTPGIIGWWASGDDDNIWNGSERMPSISPSFQATTFGFDNSWTIGGTGTAMGGSPEGTWGVGLQFNDISFIEDLSHQLAVTFIGGTNDPDAMRNYRNSDVPWSPYFSNTSGIQLTTVDYAWEIDFNHRYQIYENLAAVVEMAMLDIQREAAPWRNSQNRSNDPNYDATVWQLWKTSTAWKLALGLQYRF